MPGRDSGQLTPAGRRSYELRYFGELKHWMVRNNTAIMAAIFWLVAAKLIGDGGLWF